MGVAYTSPVSSASRSAGAARQAGTASNIITHHSAAIAVNTFRGSSHHSDGRTAQAGSALSQAIRRNGKIETLPQIAACRTSMIAQRIRLRTVQAGETVGTHEKGALCDCVPTPSAQTRSNGDQVLRGQEPLDFESPEGIYTVASGRVHPGHPRPLDRREISTNHPQESLHFLS